MAEILATMVVGPLVTMVKEKASSYLLDQYKVMEGMEEQHKLLKHMLPAVLDVITDAEEQAAKNREGAKAWLEELRKVAYKANDVLDEFKYEALRRKAKAEGHYKEFGMDVIKLFPSHNRFVFRYKMANKLHMILQQMDVLIAEMNTFRFKFKPQPPISLKWRQTDPNIPDYYDTESRDEDKEKIVDTLFDEGDNVGLTVLPIVGMGGMGKTTLAQLVYNDPAIQKHFKVRLWVCVSENFDVNSLAKRIVKEAEANDHKENENSALKKPDSTTEEPKANSSQENAESALDKLKSAVSGKRYLLVLDDVWNREASKWEKLKSCLCHGGTGSSVVTTTRDVQVAQVMGTIEAHNIKGLGERFIKEIIKIGAFGSTGEMPKEYEKMVGDIANRCKGSPLAATALGSVLRTKNTMQEWEAILSRNTICDEENGILPILKLSYNCLPPYMRQCFAFCAMFPKDHEIDVEMLIRLWMANSFIPEQQGVCPEVTGKQIFNELAQRSFFQEVQQDKFYRQITCKIHDLMHDVAQDSMGKECVAIDRKLSENEDFPYTTRHLFLSVSIPEKVLNASHEKGSLGFQTLICDRSWIQDLQSLSKFRCVRALKTQQRSFLEPKFLQHLRYLDLSRSDIKALPEDIIILYDLQTLNLSDCYNLEQLPKAMKYMTALRHLYTHGCLVLKSMPPDLGHLTSLQTLTYFVLGTGLGCSSIGELEKLDLGGQLELRPLENATGADAKAANLWDKKRLEELILRWYGGRDKEKHKEVLEGLRPPDGLKAMRMYSYGSSGIPTWMLELQGMVELELENCQNLENLPALWQLPSLQFLRLYNLQNLHCLFSGGAPSRFQKLKRIALAKMPKFETWWDTTGVQGEEVVFPEVECVTIWDCGSLTALPKASVVKQSSGKDDTECRSAFPALREMRLDALKKFHSWEAVDGTLGEHVTFPQLEKLKIVNCSGLTTFPEAPKLSTLDLRMCRGEATLQAVSRYITSLSSLDLGVPHNSDYNNKEENPIEVVVRDHESSSPLVDLVLGGCDIFFSHSSALALWNCFGQLARLVIRRCNDLVYWPEEVFQGLVSLRRLEISGCEKLTGHTKEEVASNDEQSTQSERSGTLPRLECLVIDRCESLVQLPNLSSYLKTLHINGCGSLKSVVLDQQDKSLIAASLKTLHIEHCQSLKSIAFGQHQEMGPVSGEGVVQIAAGSSSSDIDSSGSTALVLNKVSSSGNSKHCFFPCLQSLVIHDCGGLTEVTNLPPSIKTLKISYCYSLVSLSGEVPSLEELIIHACASLESLPNGPHQVYSSLKVLNIRSCGAIKQLPPSLHLQQRLNHLDERDLDHHLQERVKLHSNPEYMSDGASTDVVLKLSSSSTGSNHCFFPCLESLEIRFCNGFTVVANLPPSIKILRIWMCSSLVSVSGQVPSLETLDIFDCRNLESLPNGPHQAYSSLRVLGIRYCSGIKQLPPSLQQRLDHLEEKALDPHLLQGPAEPVPTGRIAALVSKLECFRSRSEN